MARILRTRLLTLIPSLLLSACGGPLGPGATDEAPSTGTVAEDLIWNTGWDSYGTITANKSLSGAIPSATGYVGFHGRFTAPAAPHDQSAETTRFIGLVTPGSNNFLLTVGMAWNQTISVGCPLPAPGRLALTMSLLNKDVAVNCGNSNLVLSGIGGEVIDVDATTDLDATCQGTASCVWHVTATKVGGGSISMTTQRVKLRAFISNGQATRGTLSSCSQLPYYSTSNPNIAKTTNLQALMWYDDGRRPTDPLHFAGLVDVLDPSNYPTYNTNGTLTTKWNPVPEVGSGAPANCGWSIAPSVVSPTSVEIHYNR